MQWQDPTHPTGISDDQRNAHKGVESYGQHGAATARARKANAALQMRLAGATWGEVATALGYPTPRQAAVATERALIKQLEGSDDREKLRRYAGARLERLLRSVWPKAIDPDNPDHLLAVTKAREIIDRHAKLFGLDAPQEVIVHTPTAHELETWVAKVYAVTGPTVDELDILDAEIIEDQAG